MKTRFLFYVLCLGMMLGATACNKPQQPSQDNNPNVSSSVVGKADDGAVTAKVKAALLADADVKGLDVKVETNSGVVTLSGAVDNQTQIDRAAEIARKIDGVTSVTNQLTIKK